MHAHGGHERRGQRFRRYDLRLSSSVVPNILKTIHRIGRRPAGKKGTAHLVTPDEAKVSPDLVRALTGNKVSLLNFGSYAMSLRTVLTVARHSTGAVAIVEADLHSKQMKRREYTQSETFAKAVRS